VLERTKLYKILRNLKLMDLFFIEYIFGNLNKKIAAIIVKFVKVVQSKLEIYV